MTDPMSAPKEPSVEGPISILLVEDNAADAELAIRALQRARVGNHIQLLKDGAEALDFIFCEGVYGYWLTALPSLDQNSTPQTF